jgi:Flp pilus assembly protein TadD
MAETAKQHDGQRTEELLRAARQAAERGEWEAALMGLDLVIARNAEHAEARCLRGSILLRMGQPDLALSDLECALSALPAVATCHYDVGLARLRLGRLPGALASFERCLELEPELAGAHSMRAAVLLRLGRPQDALAAISRVAALRAENSRDLHNHAVVLTALGRHREAVRSYEQALALDESSGGTLNNLAWLLATSPDPEVRDGPRAVELARRALASACTGAWLDTLAAGLAECGDFDAAVRMEREAFEASEWQNEAFRRRIEVYEQGFSYAANRRRGARHERAVPRRRRTTGTPEA